VNLSAVGHALIDSGRTLSAANLARFASQIANVLHDFELACPEVYFRPGIRWHNKRSGDNEHEV
jgi:hypothetical protein